MTLDRAVANQLSVACVNLVVPPISVSWGHAVLLVNVMSLTNQSSRIDRTLPVAFSLLVSLVHGGDVTT